MPQEFKAPLGIKIFFGAVALAFILYNMVYGPYIDSRNKDEFYKKEFSSKVVSPNSFESRMIEFHLGNGLNVYCPPSEAERTK